MTKWTQRDDAALSQYLREQFNGSPAPAPDIVPLFIHQALIRAFDRAVADARRHRRLFLAAMFACAVWAVVAVSVGVLWLTQ